MFDSLAMMLPFAISLFWAIALVLSWKYNLRAQNIWALAMVLAAVNGYYHGWTDVADFKLHYRLGTVISFTHNGFYTLVYFFYRSLVTRKPLTWKNYALFIPTILVGITEVIITLVIGEENAVIQNEVIMTKDTGGLSDDPIYKFQYFIGGIIGNLVCLFLINFTLIKAVSHWMLQKSKKGLFFALEEGQSPMHTKKAFGGLLVFLTYMLLFYVGEFVFRIDDYIPYYYVMIIQGCLSYYIGYHVFFMRIEQRRPSLKEPINDP